VSFAEDFREVVIPGLKSILRCRGFFLALGLVEFTEAYDEVMREAIRRGALFMCDADLLALEGWIARTLIKQCEEFEPAVAALAAVADRVATDIQRWEATCLLTTESLRNSSTKIPARLSN
jgi:hypothetical protein